MWGDSDYEYWVTVSSALVPDLVKHLAKEPNAGSYPSARLQEAATGVSYETKEELNRLALILLRTAFHEGMFTSDTEYRAWLKKKRIPSQFLNYA